MYIIMYLIISMFKNVLDYNEIPTSNFIKLYKVLHPLIMIRTHDSKFLALTFLSANFDSRFTGSTNRLS